MATRVHQRLLYAVRTLVFAADAFAGRSAGRARWVLQIPAGAILLLLLPSVLVLNRATVGVVATTTLALVGVLGITLAGVVVSRQFVRLKVAALVAVFLPVTLGEWLPRAVLANVRHPGLASLEVAGIRLMIVLIRAVASTSTLVDGG